MPREETTLPIANLRLTSILKISRSKIEGMQRLSPLGLVPVVWPRITHRP